MDNIRKKKYLMLWFITEIAREKMQNEYKTQYVSGVAANFG